MFRSHSIRIFIMRTHMRIRVLLATFLLASLSKTRAEAALSKMHLDDPTDLRNVINKFSDSYPRIEDRRSTECAQLGQLGNKLCLYKNNQMGLHPYMPSQPFGLWPNTVELPSKGHEDSFVDLTRLGEIGHLQGVARSEPDDTSFSEDYLDINDLSFTRKVTIDTNSPKLPRKMHREIKIVIINPQNNRPRFGRKAFNLTDPELLSILRAQVKSYHGNDEENSSSEESDEDDSKPKRFEVIEQTDDSEEEERKKLDNSIVKKILNDKYIYAQAPTRHLTLDRRRRIHHFLPKRYHWSLDDIKHLPSLWFYGPQGQYAGIYRKPL